MTRLACAGALWPFLHGWAVAQTGERLGFLLLHGKNPGGPDTPVYNNLVAAIHRENWLALLPDMPWSRRRYLTGNWDQAMQEIASHVKSLRDQGATRIVVVGHSMGCPAALSHAVRGGTVDALVLLAPGHAPQGYYTWSASKHVRESIEEARELVAAGKGEDGTHRFNDFNQGRSLTVVATAKNYLSFFDPESDAEMGRTAPRISASLPVLSVIGEKDPLFKLLKDYYVNKLPANPRSEYLEVEGGHTDTPNVAAEQVIAWTKKVLLS